MARLKSWQIFRRSRISPNRMTVITKAVLTLEGQRLCGGGGYYGMGLVSSQVVGMSFSPLRQLRSLGFGTVV